MRFFRLFNGVSLAAFFGAGCATESMTPPTVNYLQAGPAPKFSEQVEVLNGSLIQLRSGDVLLEAQAQRIDGAIGVQFFVINLSDHALSIEAKDFSLLDTRGAPARLLTIKEVLEPVRSHAARLEDKPTDEREMKSADAVVNPNGAYDGGSTNARIAKTLRGETDRLEKTLNRPFMRAVVPVNTRVGGILYFEQPASWPATLKAQAGGQVLEASFYSALINP